MGRLGNAEHASMSMSEVDLSIADQCTAGMKSMHRRNDVRSAGVIRTATLYAIVMCAPC
jgi:hypothetical protein